VHHYGAAVLLIPANLCKSYGSTQAKRPRQESRGTAPPGVRVAKLELSFWTVTTSGDWTGLR
jgi:hypothetical protein